MIASLYGHTEAVNELAKQGADLNLTMVAARLATGMEFDYSQ